MKKITLIQRSVIQNIDYDSFSQNFYYFFKLFSKIKKPTIESMCFFAFMISISEISNSMVGFSKLLFQVGQVHKGRQKGR
ncbi:hypothetical protein, partial [Klebsiella quasipneumoniae]|uniref:hypothetical protein n=1 Tax=Klebsiella quasipneumoniae TaxID=1463165 RepID=UPI001BDA03AE